jgi:hypothetical protein
VTLQRIENLELGEQEKEDRNEIFRYIEERRPDRVQSYIM